MFLLCSFIFTSDNLSESDECEINNIVQTLVRNIHDKNEFGRSLKTYCNSLQNKYDVAQRITRYNVVLYDNTFINALINLQLTDNSFHCLLRVKAESFLQLKNSIKAHKVLKKVMDKIEEVLDMWIIKMYEISDKINVIYSHTVQNISTLNAIIR